MDVYIYIVMAWIFVVGLCVGSFLNVVIWRTPYALQEVTFKGKKRPMTLSWPPSHCPHCLHEIKWYENIPVLSWLRLRAKCSNCQAPISIRYPLVELSVGIVFAGLAWGSFTGGWDLCLMWPTVAWPGLAYLLLFSAVVLAASGIDMDWFIIPMGMPIFMIILAMVFALVPWLHFQSLPNLRPDQPLANAVVGAMIGLGVANLLLWKKILPRSFPMEAPAVLATQEAAPQAHTEGPTPLPVATGQWPVWTMVGLLTAGVVGSFWLSNPGLSVLWLTVGLLLFVVGILACKVAPEDLSQEIEEEISAGDVRSELLKEMYFLTIPVVGALIGLYLPITLPQHAIVAHLLGVSYGLLVGGGLVWAIRIAGSMAFGRQAMGMGDVHLMAGVGAVLGVSTVVLGFFVAPFLGLAWALVQALSGQSRILPYGPWLGFACLYCHWVGAPLLAAYWHFMLGK